MRMRKKRCKRAKIGAIAVWKTAKWELQKENYKKKKSVDDNT